MIEDQKIETQEKRATFSKQAPFRYTITWCSHERSPLKKKEKGTLSCEGNIENCPIGVHGPKV